MKIGITKSNAAKLHKIAEILEITPEAFVNKTLKWYLKNLYQGCVEELEVDGYYVGGREKTLRITEKARRFDYIRFQRRYGKNVRS